MLGWVKGGGQKLKSELTKAEFVFVFFPEERGGLASGACTRPSGLEILQRSPANGTGAGKRATNGWGHHVRATQCAAAGGGPRAGERVDPWPPYRPYRGILTYMSL